jgi:hypothetical protein
VSYNATLAGQIIFTGYETNSAALSGGRGSLTKLQCTAVGDPVQITPLNITFSELADSNANVIPSTAVGNTFTISNVDLYVPSATVSAPGSATPGSTITVGATVNKSGSGSAAASTARIYIYGNLYGTGNKFLQIGDVAVAAFGSGSGSQAISASVTIPSWVVPGSHQIIVRADLNNDVPEWNESNNRGYKAITIVP